jgi:hypothetical protein
MSSVSMIAGAAETCNVMARRIRYRMGTTRMIPGMAQTEKTASLASEAGPGSFENRMKASIERPDKRGQLKR